MLEHYISLIQRHPLQCAPVFITLIPLWILVQRKAYIIKPYRLILIFLIVKLVLDLLMFHLATIRTNNLFLYNIGILISYCILAGVFAYKMESPLTRKLIIASIVMFPFLWLWDMIKANDHFFDFHNHAMVNFTSTLQCVLMILWILMYFYELLHSMKVPNLFKSTFFWICCGLLLYYSSFVFIAPILHYTEKWNNPMSIGFAAYLSYIFEMVYLIFFSIGFLNFRIERYARN